MWLVRTYIRIMGIKLFILCRIELIWWSWPLWSMNPMQQFNQHRPAHWLGHTPFQLQLHHTSRHSCITLHINVHIQIVQTHTYLEGCSLFSGSVLVQSPALQCDLKHGSAQQHRVCVQLPHLCDDSRTHRLKDELNSLSITWQYDGCVRDRKTGCYGNRTYLSASAKLLTSHDLRLLN